MVKWSNLINLPPTWGLIVVSAVIITLFISPLDNNRGGREKSMTHIYKMSYLVYLLIKFFLFWDCYLVNINMGHKYLYLLCSFKIVLPIIPLSLYLPVYQSPVTSSLIIFFLSPDT